jgi:hypothetical protein
MKTVLSLQALAELALAAPGAEPLAVYESVAQIAGQLRQFAAQSWSDAEGMEIASAFSKANDAAEAIRHADELQLRFREWLKK